MARFGKTMSENDKPYRDWVKDATRGILWILSCI